MAQTTTAERKAKDQTQAAAEKVKGKAIFRIRSNVPRTSTRLYLRLFSLGSCDTEQIQRFDEEFEVQFYDSVTAPLFVAVFIEQQLPDSVSYTATDVSQTTTTSTAVTVTAAAKCWTVLGSGVMGADFNKGDKCKLVIGHQRAHVATLECIKRLSRKQSNSGSMKTPAIVDIDWKEIKRLSDTYADRVKQLTRMPSNVRELPPGAFSVTNQGFALLPVWAYLVINLMNTDRVRDHSEEHRLLQHWWRIACRNVPPVTKGEGRLAADAERLTEMCTLPLRAWTYLLDSACSGANVCSGVDEWTDVQIRTAENQATYDCEDGALIVLRNSRLIATAPERGDALYKAERALEQRYMSFLLIGTLRLPTGRCTYHAISAKIDRRIVRDHFGVKKLRGPFSDHKQYLPTLVIETTQSTASCRSYAMDQNAFWKHLDIINSDVPGAALKVPFAATEECDMYPHLITLVNEELAMEHGIGQIELCDVLGKHGVSIAQLVEFPGSHIQTHLVPVKSEEVDAVLQLAKFLPAPRMFRAPRETKQREEKKSSSVLCHMWLHKRFGQQPEIRDIIKANFTPNRVTIETIAITDSCSADSITITRV